MRLSRRGALAFLGGAAGYAATCGSAGAFNVARREVAVAARVLPAFEPRNPERRDFGALTYRGGLELRAHDADFGGFSALWRSPDGSRIIAISDQGSWLMAEPVVTQGRLSGLGAAVMAPILNAAGKPLGRTRSYDTESLTIGGGIAYIGIERTHEILRFDWEKDGFLARGMPVAVPAAVKRLPANRGLEAIGILPPELGMPGALIAISERSGAADAPTLGWIIAGPKPGPLQVQRRGGFDITDLAFLPGGDMLLLERWYVPWRGVAFRIRRVKGTGIHAGALLDGETLIEADLGYEIDNMEGLSVHVDKGRTILTLISDDNFSFLQRTILLEFSLG